MKARRRNSLVLFVAISLAVHLVVLRCFANTTGETPRRQGAVTVITPQEATPEADTPKLPALTRDPGLQRYRPADTPQDDAGGPPKAPDDTGKDKTTAQQRDDLTPARANEEAVEAQTPAPRPMTPEEHTAYRETLLHDFDPDWTVIPDLVVKADAGTQAEVGRYFGMKLIAYPKGERNPSYVVVVDEVKGGFKYTKDFDFSTYSNRAKDRSNLPRYSTLARRIKSRLALPEELAIVSLVPSEVDRYFAAKQLAAIEQAGLSPEEVARTEGRYTMDIPGRRCLVISTVVPKHGRPVRARDAEARATRRTH